MSIVVCFIGTFRNGETHARMLASESISASAYIKGEEELGETVGGAQIVQVEFRRRSLRMIARGHSVFIFVYYSID